MLNSAWVAQLRYQTFAWMVRPLPLPHPLDPNTSEEAKQHAREMLGKAVIVKRRVPKYRRGNSRNGQVVIDSETPHNAFLKPLRSPELDTGLQENNRV